jgi:hypothetical protein
MILKYRDWEFEVDTLVTRRTYERILESGAESCTCGDCRNYVASRDNVFPEEILRLFEDMGIDYRKEVEIITWEVLSNGRHQISGWFHFAGRVLKGKDYRIPLPGGGFTYELTKINDNFEIGFAEGSDLTFFDKEYNLVQVQFMTSIDWISDKSPEMK